MRLRMKMRLWGIEAAALMLREEDIQSKDIRAMGRD